MDKTWKYFGIVGGYLAPGYRTNSRDQFTFIADNNDQYYTPWGGPFERGTNPNGSRPHFEQWFGSAHPGTVSATFADGSVHSLSMDTTHEVISDICNYADGFVVDHEAF